MSSRTGRWTLLGTRAAVTLAAVAAVLSFVAGVVGIGATTVQGPLAMYVPASVQRTAGFTGTITGFALLMSVYGLRRRFRAAWYLAVVLLPVAALQGLAQSNIYAYPLVIVSVLALPSMVLSRRAFDRSLELTTSQYAALAALLGVFVYGTVGSYALREQFSGVDSVTDAFYYTVVTASTVGYGDVTPATEAATLFTTSLVILGTASFAVALGTLLAPLLEARLSQALGRMSDSSLDVLDNHVVVVGYGDLTEPILEELADVPFVVILRDSDRASRLSDLGYDVVTADPSDEEPLQRVRIDRARALVVATNDDARDALAILTARELNPGLRIVAAATERENVKKLRRAGADSVISPATLGGHLLVESALGGDESTAEEVADRIVSGTDH